MPLNTKHDMFPSDEAINLSKEFEIYETVAMFQVIGLNAGDVMCLEYFFGEECDGEWQPMNIDCEQVCFNCNGTHYFSHPGKYRFVLTSDMGEHLSDPSWFENVKLQISKLPTVRTN